MISADPAFSLQAEAFCRSLQILTGKTVSEGTGGIVFVKDPSLPVDSYVLESSEKGLILTASGVHGLGSDSGAVIVFDHFEQGF